jgi:acyl-CoA thioester hydrolase
MAEAALERADFPYFRRLQTRWMDNDAYGHVNNVVYYAYFDTAITGFLIKRGVLDYQKSPAFGIAVETHCQFFKELSFPEEIDAGLRVARLGRSSVKYEIALYRKDDPEAAAFGYFVHVYVDRASRRPVPVPDAARALLSELVVGGDSPE